MTCDTNWTTYLSALLTPTVAVLGSFIAYRQWRTAQNKLKLELFDRRFAVYDTTTTFLASAMNSGAAKDEEFKFMSATHDAKWLLNTDIAEYLEDIYRKAVSLQFLVSELQDLPIGEERSANIHMQREIKEWLLKQYEVLDEKLAPYLRLEH